MSSYGLQATMRKTGQKLKARTEAETTEELFTGLRPPSCWTAYLSYTARTLLPSGRHCPWWA